MFLLCVIDRDCKYTGIVPLKNKKCIASTNAFLKVLNESRHKPNKIWVDKGSGFCNRSIKSWLKDNGKDMYSTHKMKENLVLLKNLLVP